MMLFFCFMEFMILLLVFVVCDFNKRLERLKLQVNLFTLMRVYNILCYGTALICF